MLTNRLFQKVLTINRLRIMGLLAILAITVATGFIWILTDQVIAPPGLRMMDWLWRAVVCRC